MELIPTKALNQDLFFTISPSLFNDDGSLPPNYVRREVLINATIARGTIVIDTFYFIVKSSEDGIVDLINMLTYLHH